MWAWTATGVWAYSGIMCSVIPGPSPSSTRGVRLRDYSLKKKVHLGFAPGIVYFPMNNMSIQVSVCLADLSYNNITAWSEGKVVGTRNAWKAQAHLNIMDITFGLTIHL